jgi:hypothetical protein
MKDLQRVRGRVKAKDLKKGRIYYTSGIGGVNCVSIDSKPFRYKDAKGFKSSYLKNTWWVMMTSLDYTTRSSERSLGDMGITCLGGYRNINNRIFKTKKQADNWQVYLDVSGQMAEHISDQEDYDAVFGFAY